MRLLHTTKLELTEFVGEKSTWPKYAILSHTWGEGEILFSDMQHGREHLLACGKPGLAKILKAAEMARRDRYRYIWIDTCCIDKSSSAELSEAINSMFAWYRDAEVCYAYISDFHSEDPTLLSTANRWFTRGWTLQELIAPPSVEFYNADWIKVGDRAGLATQLSSLTRVDELVFRRHPYNQCSKSRLPLHVNRSCLRTSCQLCRLDLAGILESFCVATRMSWAAYRQTTREEDMAYSLFGIFGVNMPLLYGEGRQAFQRLQHEIVRRSTDQSIFAFSGNLYQPSIENALTSIFADSPFSFKDQSTPLSVEHFSPGPPIVLLSNVGVQLDLYIAPCESHDGLWVAVLRCCSVEDALCSPALILQEFPGSSRVRSFGRLWVSDGFWGRKSLLVQVHAGSGIAMPKKVMWAKEKFSFDPEKLRPQNIILHANHPHRDDFKAPPSRIRFRWPFNPPLDITHRYTPASICAQVRGTGHGETNSGSGHDDRPVVTIYNAEVCRTDDITVVCGVVRMRPQSMEASNQGIVLVWGSTWVFNPSGSRAWTRLPRMDKQWWLEENATQWYTAVYPWTPARPGSGDAVAMDEEMSDFSSVQALLARCCDNIAAITDASELIHHAGGGCKRTWMIAEPWGKRRVSVKAVIKPVMFLERQVMDITVTVVPNEEKHPTAPLPE